MASGSRSAVIAGGISRSFGFHGKSALSVVPAFNSTGISMVRVLLSHALSRYSPAGSPRSRKFP
jgi:hypothetical protein